MPTYTFLCPGCGRKYNIVRTMNENAPVNCLDCKSVMKKIITGGLLGKIRRSEDCFDSNGKFDHGQYESQMQSKHGDEYNMSEVIPLWNKSFEEKKKEEAEHIKKYGFI